MLKLMVLAVLVLVFAIPAVAAKFLPWYGTLGVILAEVVLLIVGVPVLIKFGIMRFAKGLFETKSRVLRGASVQIHDCRVVPEPPLDTLDGVDDEDDDPEPAAELAAEREAERARVARFVMVDCTITPDSGQCGPMSHWEPSEILLVPFDKDTSFSATASDDRDDDEEANVATITLLDDGGNETDDFDKVVDRNRFRFTFACPDSLTGRVKLRYYFEGIGDFEIPDTACA